MDAALRDLLDLLDLEQIDRDIFRGRSPDEGWQRVYGGQVIGQALVAASRTVSEPERLTHSLHGTFSALAIPPFPSYMTSTESETARVSRPDVSLLFNEVKRFSAWLHPSTMPRKD